VTTPLLLVPLRLEAAAVRAGVPDAPIRRIGMGPIRATVARARLQEEPPRPLALVGVGGGLVAGMAPGDVVVATSVSTRGGAPIALRHASEVALACREAGCPVTEAPIVSSPKIVSGAAARAAAASDGAVAVDMEAYWCAPLAVTRPFVVVRVLLDVPGAELVSWRLPRACATAWRSLKLAARAVASWSPTSLDPQSLLEVGDS